MTDGDKQNLCGWVLDEAERDRMASMQKYPSYGDAAGALKDSGKGKDVFLWELEKKLFGQVRDPHAQTEPDCVSHGLSGAGEDLLIVQITKGESAKFELIASEPIYGGARHEVGGDRLGRGGGAVVGWAIQWAQQWGLLPRRNYTEVGIDLSVYNGKVAANWGSPRVGVPDALEPLAKKFPLVTCSLIESNYYEAARDVIANGGLVVTGSDQLYSDTRDQFGFCTPHGRGGHCTYYRGVSDNPRRPGIAYQQSWGKMIPRGNQSVQLPHGVKVDLPLGCFFIDAAEFNRMHRGQEVWAVTHMAGWEPAPDDWNIRFL